MTTFYLVILLLKSHPAVISAGEILLIFKRMKDILIGSEFMPHPGSYTSVCKYKIFQILISMKIWVVLVRGLDITLWSCGEYSPL